MAASGGKRGQKRASLPLPEGQQIIDLSVELLAARCAGSFGKGFRLKAIGRRLYVQLAGRKVPLYLDFDADPADVQERALTLLRFRHARGSGFDADDWRDEVGVKRARTGKAPGSIKKPLTLEEVIATWQRFKTAQGVGSSSFNRHYLIYMKKLDPVHPLGDDSLLGVIECTDPRRYVRRRVVIFLRQLCQLCGYPWNSTLLDPLQNAGAAVLHRPQPFFSDGEIVRLLDMELRPGWRRVVTLLAVYGLRPWEAWVAEPSMARADCVWIPSGKTNRYGTTPPRQVPPFHPEWVERFQMPLLWRHPLPALKNQSKAGVNLNVYLRRKGWMPAEGQTSYGFRHAYARRLHSPRYRVTDAHAAFFMGHTVAVHSRVYSDWLGDSDPIGIYLDRPS
jgi:integrase